MLTAVERSTLPEALAEVSAVVRTRVQGVMRKRVPGGARTRRRERGGGCADDERSEADGMSAAMGPKARGMPGRRGETAQRARQGHVTGRRSSGGHC